MKMSDLSMHKVPSNDSSGSFAFRVQGIFRGVEEMMVGVGANESRHTPNDSDGGYLFLYSPKFGSLRFIESLF